MAPKIIYYLKYEVNFCFVQFQVEAEYYVSLMETKLMKCVA